MNRYEVWDQCTPEEAEALAAGMYDADHPRTSHHPTEEGRYRGGNYGWRYVPADRTGDWGAEWEPEPAPWQREPAGWDDMPEPEGEAGML